jgi:hypothetical protein
MNRLTHPSARPTLEALEDRAVPAAPPSSYMAAAIPGQGVWLYTPSDASTRLLTANNASLVAADGIGDVAAAFPGWGVWLYSRGTWIEITANNNAASIDMDSQTVYLGSPGTAENRLTTIVVAAEFSGQGLWRYTFTTTGTSPAAAANWMQLTANDAATEAVDRNGVVAAAFHGAGVWRFADSTGWQQLTPMDATSLASGARTQGQSWVVAALAGQGVWRFNDSTGWQQLTAANASTVATDLLGFGSVIANFPGSGVWSYFDPGTTSGTLVTAGWNHLTAAEASTVAMWGFGEYYGQFPGAGIWYSPEGTWLQFTADNPSSFSAGGSY